jgi:hypothetical protein
MQFCQIGRGVVVQPGLKNSRIFSGKFETSISKLMGVFLFVPGLEQIEIVEFFNPAKFFMN